MRVCLYSCLSYAARKSHLSMQHNVFCALSGSTIFSTLSHKRRDFRKKKVTAQKKSVSIFLYKFCLKHLILRRIQRDIIVYVHRYSCKVPVILVQF